MDRWFDCCGRSRLAESMSHCIKVCGELTIAGGGWSMSLVGLGGSSMIMPVNSVKLIQCLLCWAKLVDMYG